ncbi:type II secretion system protein [Cryobacterium sp. MDB1-18-2]|uniref:type II secretion system protein n=1 Tax=unclassified Cryobacterium TaxID=2649013 RepID=UPI00106C8C00|nr:MULTISPECIES: type II secretion system protein [unclassified Cryobacterium]TFC35937.1 type II secretion system protein [Cryobacterium sp. MDB1-18-2]TFC41557.1 type II secretion system protein [Cryobacterium sp. MDB1-18-1]
MKLPLHHARADESTGMTLIEVIVAISIMGIIAAAAVGLSITSQSGAVAQQRQELAVTIANQAMESVSAQSAVTGALVAGRSQSNVSANWTNAINSGTSGLSDTYPAWDPGATAASVATVPILSAPLSLSGTTYTTNILVGTCYQKSVGATAPGTCTKVAGYTAPSLPEPTGWSPVLRVMVIVRWNAGGVCSGTAGCSYQTTSLVDTHIDLPWDTN